MSAPPAKTTKKGKTTPKPKRTKTKAGTKANKTAGISHNAGRAALQAAEKRFQAVILGEALDRAGQREAKNPALSIFKRTQGPSFVSLRTACGSCGEKSGLSAADAGHSGALGSITRKWKIFSSTP
jgi:hypothetical protein